MYWDKVFSDILTYEPSDTKSIAKKVGCDYVTALNNLRRLSFAGKIQGKKLNGTQWVWWKKI